MSIYSGFVYERRPGEREARKRVDGGGETRGRSGGGGQRERGDSSGRRMEEGSLLIRAKDRSTSRRLSFPRLKSVVGSLSHTGRYSTRTLLKSDDESCKRKRGGR